MWVDLRLLGFFNQDHIIWYKSFGSSKFRSDLISKLSSLAFSKKNLAKYSSFEFVLFQFILESTSYLVNLFVNCTSNEKKNLKEKKKKEERINNSSGISPILLSELAKNRQRG